VSFLEQSFFAIRPQPSFHGRRQFFTYKDGLAVLETDIVRRNKQKTLVLVGLVEPDYFIVAATRLLCAPADHGQGQHQSRQSIIFCMSDDELDLYPVDVMCSKHIQTAGGRCIHFESAHGHPQQQVSQRHGAARALRA
jgi:hypothetical protein